MKDEATRLTVAEVISKTYRTNPEPLQVQGPDGVKFTQELAFEEKYENGSLRIYTVKFASPEEAVGVWTLLTQTGNELMVWGSDPPAKVERFEVAVKEEGALAAASGAAPRLALQQGQSFQVAWEVTNDQPGLAVDVYAEDAAGTHHSIAAQETQVERRLVGALTWTRRCRPASTPSRSR